MQYNIYPPSELLSKYIKYYWTLEGLDGLGASKERIFPDGCMELIFHYGDVFRKYTNEFEAHNQPRSFIHGQLKRFIEVESTGKIGVFSIRFMPNGLHPFLKMGVDELTGNAVNVRQLWGSEGADLEEKILAAPSTQVRIKIIEAFLLLQFKFATHYNAIDHCVRSIQDSAGTKSVENLSNEVNMGRRQLERKFISAVGLSPKTLIRIVRFQNTLRDIQRIPAGALTGVAYASGFYDQSHFINDFKEFTGLSPRQYFTADLEFAKYLTTA